MRQKSAVSLQRFGGLMSYQPRGMSKAAIEAVRANGPMWSGELAEAIGCDAEDLTSITAVAVRNGLLHRHLKDNGTRRVNRYSLGNGIPLLPFGKEANMSAPTAFKPAGAPVSAFAVGALIQASAVEATPNAGVGGFTVGIYSDGRLMLEIDGENLVLDAERTDLLRIFLMGFTGGCQLSAA
jgi:hypothetical protein